MRHLAWLACIGVITVACGSGRQTGVRVDFVVFGEPEEVRGYQAVIDAYESSQDEVRVRLVVAAGRSDLLTRVSTAIAAGSPPDLFLVNYRFYGQYASAGALEPLADRFERSVVFEREDFYPVALEAFEWNGSQTCIPQNVSSLVVYYNRALFEGAGIDEPPDEWSWNDMVSAAATLTTDGDGDGTTDQHGLGVEPGIIRLAPFVWSAGGTLFDDAVRPTTFTIDTAPGLVAVERFLQLRTVHRVVPSDEEMEAENLESRFMNGRLAMLLSSRRLVPELRSVGALSWDVAPLPVASAPANVLHSDAVCMTARSSHHDEAWDFLEFALGRDGQVLLAETGRTVPSLRAVAESPAFLDPLHAPSRSDVFLEAIPHLRRLPRISTWPEIEDIADVLIEEAMFEPAGGEVVELTAALRKETNGAFKRSERGG